MITEVFASTIACIGLSRNQVATLGLLGPGELSLAAGSMGKRWGCSRPTPSRCRTEPSQHTTTEPGNKSGSVAYAKRSTTEDRKTVPLAGSQLYSTVRPRQFIVVPLNQPPEKPERAECTHHSNRRPPLQATPLPRCRLQPQPHPTTDHRRPEQRPSRPTSRLETPVSPFVVALCPAPPVARQRAATALPRTPPRPVHGRNHAPPQLLLRPHSQS